MSKGVQKNYKHDTMTSVLKKKILKELKRVHPNEKEQRVAVEEILVHRKLVSNFILCNGESAYICQTISRKKGEKMLFGFICY